MAICFIKNIYLNQSNYFKERIKGKDTKIKIQMQTNKKHIFELSKSIKLNHRRHVVTLINLPMSKDIQSEITKVLMIEKRDRQRTKRQQYKINRKNKYNIN